MTTKFYCGHIYNQVREMEKVIDEEKYRKYKHIYLDNILTCSTFGFAEFLSEERIAKIIATVGSDGSVSSGTVNGTLSDVLTAETASFLVGALRMTTELDYWE